MYVVSAVTISEYLVACTHLVVSLLCDSLIPRIHGYDHDDHCKMEVKEDYDKRSNSQVGMCVMMGYRWNGVIGTDQCNY